MTFNEKRALVRLLHRYQDEQIGNCEANKQETKDMEMKNKPKWEGSYIFGAKAQYNHARIIADRLSSDISKELSSSLDL